MIPGSLGVIPARIGASRLPRKPLHMLAGRPMIEWVWRRVSDAAILDTVVVATDSEEIARAVGAFGGRAVLTDAGHASGTDRVAEVVRRPEFRGFGLVMNVQGDEPFVRATDLAAAARLVARDGWPIGTVACPLVAAAELGDPAVVKVVRGSRGQALYFSRAAVPYPREGGPDRADLGSGLYLRHLGLYVYRRDALLEWVGLPEGDLERIERLEQLRPLAAGLAIGVGLVEPGRGGVDTPADALRAERFLLSDYPLGVTTRT